MAASTSSRSRITRRTWGVLFVLPSVLFFLVVSILPMLYAVFLSFHDWNLLGTGARPFVFLENYLALFSDAVFLRALWNTFLYCVLTVPLGLCLALAVALLLNSGIRWVGFFRTVYFIPYVTSIIAAGYIWSWLYDPTFGFLNHLLAYVGVQLPFLKSTTGALPSIAAMAVWRNLGFDVVILLAGLQGIPDTVYEAARVDNASARRTFTHVTLPLLNPTLVFLTVMGVLRSVKIFGEIYVMADHGGPLGSTRSVVSHIVETSFDSYRMGYGSAMTMVLFGIILFITVVQMKFLTRKYDG